MPPASSFYCFGVDSAGAPLVAQATINDYGTADFAAVGSGPTATTAPTTTTSPVVGSAQGSGSQVVQVDPITGPTIVAVTHDGAGEFAVQPQQGGVPAGAPVVSATGPWSGRYLVGPRRDDLRLRRHRRRRPGRSRVQQRSSALTFDPATGVSGENPDVVAYDEAAPWAATVGYDGPGPIVVRSVTVSGSQELVNQAGPFSGDIEVPAGPGFVTVDAVGAWSLQPVTPTASPRRSIRTECVRTTFSTPSTLCAN